MSEHSIPSSGVVANVWHLGWHYVTWGRTPWVVPWAAGLS